MKSLILLLVLVGTSGWSDAYNYQRSSSYTSSRSSSSSPTVSYQTSSLSPWAQQHMDVVQLMANELRQLYNARSRGTAARYTNQAWSQDFANSIGKSSGEINDLTQKLSNQIVTDMQSGRLSYGQVAQPNFFETKAAMALEQLAEDSEYVDDNQQRQVDLYEPGLPPTPHTELDLSKFDDVKHFTYPTQVKVVDGQTFVTNKNCTTATTRGGTAMNPIVRTVRVNSTTTHSTVPYYVSQGNPFLNRQEHSIYRHLDQQETQVPNYSPQVTINENLNSGMNQMNSFYTPPIVIPVEGGDMSETIGIGNQYGIRPGQQSTVTVKKINRKIITGPDGIPMVSGSQSETVWDNGQVVYNNNTPFGTTPFGTAAFTKDDIWKREERERLFWLFQDGIINNQELEKWQTNQEDRLLALAQRSHIQFEDIKEWQRRELDRYKTLVNQYTTRNSNLLDWQKREQGRIDWLIHQNGINREDLERWQKENAQRLAVIARQYQISIEELTSYYRQELNRLHVIFNQQNSQINSSVQSNVNIIQQQQERDRLNRILLAHNSTLDQLREQIRRDQERYKSLTEQYQGSVKDQELYLKNELERLTRLFQEQQSEMLKATEWQLSERQRLENIIRHHNLTVGELEQRMQLDRKHLQELSQKYHISMEDLEKWQRSELDRLHESGKMNLQKEFEKWQQEERARMLAIIKKNDLTIEDYQSKIGNDRARIAQLASTYQVQVEEIEKWLKEEALKLKNEGVFSEVQKNLTMWQQQERDRLQAIVQNNELTIEELQNKINQDQNRLYVLANTYQVRVEEVEDWLKKEILRLQSQGLVKAEDLQDWQRTEREKILQLIEANKLTVEDYEKRLLNDKSYLQQLANQYHVELKDIETWLRKESDRLQSLGLIEEEKLNEWQKIERERLLKLVQKNDLSIEDIEKQIKNDQVHLYSLAHRYSVRVEEIEEWLKNEVLRLQNQQMVESANLKDWQKTERERIMLLVQQNDLTIDEFLQKIKIDRVYLQQLAQRYNVQIEEIEEWARNEGTRLETLGLIKPNAALTEWQEMERDHVLQVVQGGDQLSLDELEQRLESDRLHLFNVAQQYQVQVQDIEEWTRRELQRLQNQGLVQIEKLKEWQQNERKHLEELLAQQKVGFSVDEFERQLKADRQRLQNLAYQNNVQVKEIEEWIHNELARMQAQGQAKIDNLTEWQKKELDYLLLMAQQHSDLSAAELEKELQTDRNRLHNLAQHYHIEVEEVEEFIRKQIQKLRDQGKLHIENLTAWQIEERQRLQQLIQQQSQLSVEEVERQLKTDRIRLQQLAYKYHIQVEEVEAWIRKEADRLRNQGELHIGNLMAWQQNERQRIQELIQKNNDLTVEEIEWQLKADQNKIQQLANQYHVSVEEIEEWIKTEVQRLRNEGKLKIDELNAWQTAEKQRLLYLAQQQSNLTLFEFEEKLGADRRRLELLAQQYHVSVQEIEEWIRKEAERLENLGIIGNLEEWQKLERSRIHDMLRQSNLTVEEFQEELRRDHGRLQNLAYQYHTTVEEIEEWIFKEGSRQIRPEALSLSSWQVNETNRLQHLIQNGDFTREELERTIQNERNRISQIAQHYHVTIEEIEEYIRTEGQRLIKPTPSSLTEWQVSEHERLIQEIGQPQSLTLERLDEQLNAQQYRLQQIAQQYHITVEEIEEWIRQEGRRLIKPIYPLVQQGHLAPWQQHEREYLLALVQNNHITKKTNFENRLVEDEMRMSNVAYHFQISVEDIKKFLRKEYQRLLSMNVISDGEDIVDTVNIVQWQGPEQQHIQQLLQEHTYSFEELERQLKNDNEHLQQLANQYHVTVNEIEEWYRSELQKLLQQRQLQSENLSEWQKREKNRLYTTIVHQKITIEELRRQLERDDGVLRRLAAQYRITLDELINWQLREVQRLANLGYGKPAEISGMKDWQVIERKRLRSIPEMVIITREELLQFIQSDRLFQNNLTAKYEVSPQELMAFQSQELQVMENEEILENLNLKHLEEWQRRERDRLYNLIHVQSFTSKDLPQWQTDDKIIKIASTYHLPANTLKNWQREEMQRIENVARHYKMSLVVLEDYRRKEIERLETVAHKDYITEEEYISWTQREAIRLSKLGQRTGLSGAQLDKWRRKLYLLAQGLIDLDFNEGGYGGVEVSTTTSASGKRNETISSDRGDQPPQVYHESEESEPNLMGFHTDTMPPMLSQSYPPPSPPAPAYLPVATREDKSHHGYDSGHPSHHHNQHNSAPAVGNEYYGSVHRRKEYEFKPSNYQGRYSQGRGTPYSNMQTNPGISQNEDDLGQQTQVDTSYEDVGQKSEKFEEYDQQQQFDMGQQIEEKFGDLNAEEIGGQQVQQETYQAAEVEQIHRNQKQLDHNSYGVAPLVDTSAAASQKIEVVTAEPVTEKPKSIWGKAKSWFG